MNPHPSSSTDRTRYDWSWFRARPKQYQEGGESPPTLEPASSETEDAQPDGGHEVLAQAKEQEPILLGLLSDLEEMLFAGLSIPGLGRVVVERNSLLDLIDQLRDTLPQTILEAEQIKRREGEIIEEARNRAHQFVARAQREGDSLIEEERIVVKARERAQQIVQQAEDEAARVRSDAQADATMIRRQAEEEVESVYDRLALNLERILQQLKSKE